MKSNGTKILYWLRLNSCISRKLTTIKPNSHSKKFSIIFLSERDRIQIRVSSNGHDRYMSQIMMNPVMEQLLVFQFGHSQLKISSTHPACASSSRLTNQGMVSKLSSRDFLRVSFYHKKFVKTVSQKKQIHPLAITMTLFCPPFSHFCIFISPIDRFVFYFIQKLWIPSSLQSTTSNFLIYIKFIGYSWFDFRFNCAFVFSDKIIFVSRFALNPIQSYTKIFICWFSRKLCLIHSIRFDSSKQFLWIENRKTTFFCHTCDEDQISSHHSIIDRAHLEGTLDWKKRQRLWMMSQARKICFYFGPLKWRCQPFASSNMIGTIFLPQIITTNYHRKLNGIIS